MRNKVFLFLLAAALLTYLGLAQAQQPKKVPLIGYFSSTDPATESARAETIRLALRERGYIEGQTSPSNTDIQRGSEIGSLSLPLSWCVSRLISSW